MTTKIGNIHIRLSGGASNANPQLSLGGVRSTAMVTSQTVADPSQVTGVTIKAAHNNPEGAGTLKFTLTGNTLSWRPPSSAVDYSSTVSGDGEYILGDPAAGFIVVDVVASSLPAGSRTDTLGVNPTFGALFDTVQPAESLAGKTEYRCTYIYNNGDTVAYNARVWISSQTTGQDSVQIALDPAGVGNGTSTGVAIVIADEEDTTDQLGAVTFSAPASISAALTIGDIAPASCAAIWEKRIVPANVTQQDLDNNYQLSIAVDL